MSLVELLSSQLHSKRVVIIYFESWHFMVCLYKKNSFNFMRLVFLACDVQDHFRYILLFYYRKDENTVQTRKKVTQSVWRRCINGTSMSKLVFIISIEANRQITRDRICRIPLYHETTCCFIIIKNQNYFSTNPIHTFLRHF